MSDQYLNPYIIAEIGNNHEGNVSLAYKLIDAAKAAGADAAKFQTFIPHLFQHKSDIDRIKKLEHFQLSFDEFKELANYCRSINIEFISTPLDLVSL